MPALKLEIANALYAEVSIGAELDASFLCMSIRCGGRVEAYVKETDADTDWVVRKHQDEKNQLAHPEYCELHVIVFGTGSEAAA